MPGNGPRLHRTMQSDFVTDDDASDGPDGEPGEVTERSAP
jgi:hypothetical protein